MLLTHAYIKIHRNLPNGAIDQQIYRGVLNTKDPLGGVTTGDDQFCSVKNVSLVDH